MDRSRNLVPLARRQFQQANKLGTLRCPLPRPTPAATIEYNAALRADNVCLFAERKDELVAGIKCTPLARVLLFVGFCEKRESVAEVLKAAGRIVCND